MKQVLVTGATGLIGSHLIEQLVANGWQPTNIRALVRPTSNVEFLRRQGVQFCYGDLLDVDSLKAAMKDVSVVFHCAALLGNRGEFSAQVLPGANWRINYRGTEHMLEAACEVGVDRFIHTSTLGIHGLPGEYAESKRAAEQQVQNYARTGRLKTVIIRPPVTVGQRDRLLTPHLIRLARRKIVPLINHGVVHIPFADARDVAAALILASRHPQAVGRAYDLAGFFAPLHEVIRFFSGALGHHPRMVNVPYSAAHLAALLGEVAMAVARRNCRPIRSGHLVKLVRLLATGLSVDTGPIRRELGFEPRYTMQETFEHAIRWYLAQEEGET